MLTIFNMRTACIWVSLLATVSGFVSVGSRSQNDVITSTHMRLASTTDGNDDSAIAPRIEKDTCDVAIFGGGFGGLYTALAMARELQQQQQRNNNNAVPQTNLDIALVTPGDNFVFLPLLYDLTMGTASAMEVCPSYKSVLQETGIRHIQATLDDIDDLDGYSAMITSNNDKSSSSQTQLSYRAAVIAVGATPQSILEAIPGAKDYTQPYYTKENAEETNQLLKRLEEAQASNNNCRPRIAVVGGGYGGVELATCVKRRIPNSHVSLLTRGPPMKGTRAEALIDQALKRLQVHVQICSVESVEKSSENEAATENTVQPQVIVKTKPLTGSTNNDNEDGSCTWDAVLWTAGSGPAYPVVEGLDILNKVESSSGRLAIDNTLRCMWKENRPGLRPPRIWAMGDCAEMFSSGFATPKTAQAAMQQADVVANNVLCVLGIADTRRRTRQTKTFQYQDLGTALSLGGPNGVILAPPENSPLAPLVTPAIEIARFGFGIADGIFTELTKKKSSGEDGTSKKQTDLGATVENLGLSLGGYGLGVDPNVAPGTLAGTLSGAARRTLYALRMPTNRQRIYAATSAAISTATALAKEAAALNESDGKDDIKNEQ